MSPEFARLDTSKPGDSHAIVMRKRKRKRKRMARGRAAGTDVPCSGQKANAGQVRCYRTPRDVSRQCDEVKAMAASGMIARASLL
jgi:hypothetical protein